MKEGDVKGVASTNDESIWQLWESMGIVMRRNLEIDVSGKVAIPPWSKSVRRFHLRLGKKSVAINVDNGDISLKLGDEVLMEAPVVAVSLGLILKHKRSSIKSLLRKVGGICVCASEVKQETVEFQIKSPKGQVKLRATKTEYGRLAYELNLEKTAYLATASPPSGSLVLRSLWEVNPANRLCHRCGTAKPTWGAVFEGLDTAIMVCDGKFFVRNVDRRVIHSIVI